MHPCLRLLFLGFVDSSVEFIVPQTADEDAKVLISHANVPTHTQYDVTLK